MSYKDRFRYDRDDTGEARFWVYFHRPESIYEESRIPSLDKTAESDIKKLEELIADLKEYRQDLARRYSELAAMTYTLKLYLVREKSWSTKKVTYTVRLARVYPDGKEVNQWREVYSGDQRSGAFALFEQHKKAHPGIETVRDIEKKQWEK